MKQGPNVKRLIAHKMSLLMIPPGTENGLATGVNAIRKSGNLLAVCKEATEWVEAALGALKDTPDNPWGDDDEAIAGDILRQVSEKKRARCKAAGMSDAVIDTLIREVV